MGKKIGSCNFKIGDIAGEYTLISRDLITSKSGRVYSRWIGKCNNCGKEIHVSDRRRECSCKKMEARMIIRARRLAEEIQSSLDQTYPCNFYRAAVIDCQTSRKADPIGFFASVLTDREIDVLIGRFMENKTLYAIGEQRGVTRERIRQIESKALRKIAGIPSQMSALSSDFATYADFGAEERKESDDSSECSDGGRP